jgi:hypothetical protein
MAKHAYKVGKTSESQAAFDEAVRMGTSVSPGMERSLSPAWANPLVEAAIDRADGTAAKRWFEASHPLIYEDDPKAVLRLVDGFKALALGGPLKTALEKELKEPPFPPGEAATYQAVEKARFLSNMALAQLRLGEGQAAIFTLKRAIEAVSQPIFGDTADETALGTLKVGRADALVAIARRAALMGQVNEAKASLQQALALTAEAKSSLYGGGEMNYRAYLAGQAAVVYAQLRELPLAFDTLADAGRSEYLVDQLLELETEVGAPPAATSSPSRAERPMTPLLHRLLATI